MSGSSDLQWPFCAAVPTVDVRVGTKGAWWRGLDARCGPAFELVAAILAEEGFDPDAVDTGAYNCRNTSAGSPSPHGRRIATDSDWQENAAWSRGSIPSDRFAHTTFSPRIIARILSIRTRVGNQQVFEWGGFWRTFYDPMHVQVNVPPASLAGGIYEPGGEVLDMETIGRWMQEQANRVVGLLTAVIVGQRSKSLFVVAHRSKAYRRTHGVWVSDGCTWRRPSPAASGYAAVAYRRLHATRVYLSIEDLRTFEASVPLAPPAG